MLLQIHASHLRTAHTHSFEQQNVSLSIHTIYIYSYRRAEHLGQRVAGHVIVVEVLGVEAPAVALPHTARTARTLRRTRLGHPDLIGEGKGRKSEERQTGAPDGEG